MSDFNINYNSNRLPAEIGSGLVRAGAVPSLPVLMLRTAQLDEPPARAVIMCGLGAAGEAGEVADLVKKIMFHGKPFNADLLIEELGDCLWYCAYLTKTLDFYSLDSMLTHVSAWPFDDYLTDGQNTPEQKYIRAGLGIGAAGGRMAQIVNAMLEQFSTYHRSFKIELSNSNLTLVNKIRHMASLVDCSLEDIARANVEKLERRYPSGYNHADAAARKDLN